MLDISQVVILILAVYGLVCLVGALGRLLSARPRGRGYRPFLSLLLLVKEREATVEGLIRSLAGLPYLNHTGLVNYEVIVVDEHSSDQTPLIVERLARRYGNVRFARSGNDGNRDGGRATAIATGLSLCRGRTVILLDAAGRADAGELLRTIYYLLGPKPEAGLQAKPRARPTVFGRSAGIG